MQGRKDVVRAREKEVDFLTQRHKWEAGAEVCVGWRRTSPPALRPAPEPSSRPHCVERKKKDG